MRGTEAQARGEGGGARGGRGKTHAGHLNSKAERKQFNAGAAEGTFLNCFV